MAAPRRWYIITVYRPSVAGRPVPAASLLNRRAAERQCYRMALSAARGILDGTMRPGECVIELLAAPLEARKESTQWDLPTLKAVYGDSIEVLARWTPETALQEQSRRRAAKAHRGSRR